MTIGPIIIRWTKTVQAEQRHRDTAKRISVKVASLLLEENRQYKDILRAWGLSEGVIGYKAARGGSRRSKPPKGAVASV